MTWSIVTKEDRRFRLMGAPVYKGFVARSYGPRMILPRQSQTYWHMNGRRFVIWLELQNRSEIMRRRLRGVKS